MGDDASIINDIVSGKHPLSKRLENAKKPVIIVGVDQLARPDGEAILTTLYEYGKKLSKGVSFIEISNKKSQLTGQNNSNSLFVFWDIQGMECI